MSARVQSSPFRETAFDQKLDRMLDDLKSTVSGDEGELRTPGLVRSSSRASSRAGSVGRRHDDSRRLDVFVEPNRQVDVSDGGRHLETHDSKVIDGGRMSHHHKEYTSPDNRVRTVADSYQYDSSQDNPNGNYHKKVMKSTYSSYKTDGSLGKDLEDLKRGPAELEMERALSKESRDILNSISSTNKHNKGKDEKMISNGHFDDDLHEMLPEGKGDGGEVRRIVWRNRYEKTYETTDATGSPMMSIERDARHRSPPPPSPPSLSALTHHHAPPQISPGGQSWADPVPLPTPPQQVSPREPGVAYVYNYGSSGGSAVQPLPPLNYVAVNQREGSASSPTPSSNVTPGQQPVIYHYSYHYTIQPGQPLPEGAPQPPAGAIPHPGPPTSPPATTSPSAPPALQIAPTSPTGYSSNTVSSNVNDVRNTTNVIHHHHTTTNHETHHRTNVDSHHNNVLDTYNNKNINKYPGQDPHPGTNVTGYSVDSYSTEKRDYQPFPIAPRDRSPPHSPDSRSPARPGEPKININIHETKTYSSTTRTDDHGFPITSTPHRGTSRSPDRHYGPSDSLDRVRRPPNTGLPFPNESPVKPQDPAHIPRNVDKLLSEVSERNGGVRGYSGHPDGEPLITHESQQKSSSHEQAQLAPERNEINTMSPSKLREEREKSKNQPGPAVYYPPGQEAFTESMHTMTLKEGGRRGKAKWRAEGKSGYKESSSHSESQGGTKVVPLCLPLCCGAACTIM